MLTRLTVITILAILLTLVGCSGKGGQESTPASQVMPVPDSSKAILASMDVSDQERQVLDTLLFLWSQPNDIASVDQAAERLGIELSDSTRIDLLHKLSDHLNLHPQLALYHAWTVVLTAPEKRIAQYIINYQRDKRAFPTVEMIAEHTGVSKEDVASRLKFLAATDLLYDLGGPNEYNQLGYSFGPKLGDAKFDMGLRYHTLYVEGQKPFNVGCSNEAFYKILRDLPNSKVRYETYDLESMKPVTVEFNDSKIVSIDPPSAIFAKGWFRGANCLFANRNDAEVWSNKTPNVNNPPLLDIKQYIADLTAQRDTSASWQGRSRD